MQIVFDVKTYKICRSSCFSLHCEQILKFEKNCCSRFQRCCEIEGFIIRENMCGRNKCDKARLHLQPGNMEVGGLHLFRSIHSYRNCYISWGLLHVQRLLIDVILKFCGQSATVCCTVVSPWKHWSVVLIIKMRLDNITLGTKVFVLCAVLKYKFALVVELWSCRGWRRGSIDWPKTAKLQTVRTAKDRRKDLQRNLHIMISVNVG